MLASNRKQALPQNSPVPGFEFQRSQTCPAQSSIATLSDIYQYCSWTPLSNILASVCACSPLLTRVASLEGALLIPFFRTNSKTSVCLLLQGIEAEIQENKESHYPFFSTAAFAWASPSSPVSNLASPWLTVLHVSQFLRLTCGALRQQLSPLWLPSSQPQLHLCSPTPHADTTDCATSPFRQFIQLNCWLLEQCPECMAKYGGGQERTTTGLNLTFVSCHERTFCMRR